MKKKKVITWIAVTAIILSFLAPIFSFLFEVDTTVQQQIQTGSLSN